MHVTQRGVNRCAIFIDDDDRHHYRRVLRDACRKHGVAIHAFVLMDNHVHLLLGADAPGLVSKALRQAGQTYVQSFNQRHGRVGTLWQGRFKSSLVDSNAYVLRVIRYIELNPVRAAQDPLITLHPLYLALGPDPAHRGSVYREWLHAPLQPDEITRIRHHMAQERALGDARFQAMVEKALNRPAGITSRGRPKRESTAGVD